MSADSTTLGGAPHPDDTPGGPITMAPAAGSAIPDSDAEIEALATAAQQATQPQKKALVYDDEQNLVVEVAPGKIAKLRELDGFQSIKADGMIGNSPSPLIICKIYALFSLVGLVDRGQQAILPPCKDDQQVFRRAALFKARELMILMDAYADAFMSDPVAAAELKNS